MSPTNESRRGERRVMRIQLALANFGTNGMRLTDIATAVTDSPVNTMHTLNVMAEEGFTERVPGREELWRLGVKGIQIWRNYEIIRARLLADVDGFHQRVTRAI